MPFQPRFLLRELIFAHCPHQPCSPIRGNFLYRADRLSQRNCRHRVQHLADPNITHPARWTMLAFFPLQKRSSQLAQHSDHLRQQRFGSGTSRNTSLMSGPPKPLGNGPSRASPAGASVAYPGLVTKHGRERRDLRGNAGLPDWKDPPPALWPGSGSGYNKADFQLSPMQPVARRPLLPNQYK